MRVNGRGAELLDAEVDAGAFEIARGQLGLREGGLQHAQDAPVPAGKVEDAADIRIGDVGGREGGTHDLEGRDSAAEVVFVGRPFAEVSEEHAVVRRDRSVDGGQRRQSGGIRHGSISRQVAIGMRGAIAGIGGSGQG